MTLLANPVSLLAANLLTTSLSAANPSAANPETSHKTALAERRLYLGKTTLPPAAGLCDCPILRQLSTTGKTDMQRHVKQIYLTAR